MQHSAWRIDMSRHLVLVPVAIGIRTGRESRVLTGSRIEKHLCVVDIMVSKRGTKDTEISSKSVIECFLSDVNLGYEISVVHILDYCVVVHQTERSTVIRLWCSPTESEIMIVYQSCACDYLIEISVVTTIIAVQTQSLSSGKVSVSIEHIEVLIHLLESDVSLV